MATVKKCGTAIAINPKRIRRIPSAKNNFQCVWK
jgi:hypothetical protein